MLVYNYRHRVRYRECDPMGIVYHVHYIDYFEYARTDALREFGVAYADIERAGLIMPVIDLAATYHSPARYDDLLEIRCLLEPRLPRVRLPIKYEIRRAGEDRVLVSGNVTLCFFDPSKGRPVEAPDYVQDAFQNAIDRAT